MTLTSKGAGVEVLASRYGLWPWSPSAVGVTQKLSFVWPFVGLSTHTHTHTHIYTHLYVNFKELFHPIGRVGKSEIHRAGQLSGILGKN